MHTYWVAVHMYPAANLVSITVSGNSSHFLWYHGRGENSYLDFHEAGAAGLGI